MTCRVLLLNKQCCTVIILLIVSFDEAPQIPVIGSVDEMSWPLVPAVDKLPYVSMDVIQLLPRSCCCCYCSWPKDAAFCASGHCRTMALHSAVAVKVIIPGQWWWHEWRCCTRIAATATASAACAQLEVVLLACSTVNESADATTGFTHCVIA